MSDLIDREEALTALRDTLKSGGKSKGLRPVTFEMIWAIKSLPSAQPEIIHCKDCEWCEEHYDTDGNAPYWICKNWDGGTDADGFCHEAERRIDE